MNGAMIPNDGSMDWRVTIKTLSSPCKLFVLDYAVVAELRPKQACMQNKEHGNKGNAANANRYKIKYEEIATHMY